MVISCFSDSDEDELQQRLNFVKLKVSSLTLDFFTALHNTYKYKLCFISELWDSTNFSGHIVQLLTLPIPILDEERKLS